MANAFENLVPKKGADQGAGAPASSSGNSFESLVPKKTNTQMLAEYEPSAAQNIIEGLDAFGLGLGSGYTAMGANLSDEFFKKSSEAEMFHPNYYAAGDVVGTAISPISKAIGIAGSKIASPLLNSGSYLLNAGGGALTAALTSMGITGARSAQPLISEEKTKEDALKEILESGQSKWNLLGAPAGMMFGRAARNTAERLAPKALNLQAPEDPMVTLREAQYQDALKRGLIPETQPDFPRAQKNPPSAETSLFQQKEFRPPVTRPQSKNMAILKENIPGRTDAAKRNNIKMRQNEIENSLDRMRARFDADNPRDHSGADLWNEFQKSNGYINTRGQVVDDSWIKAYEKAAKEFFYEPPVKYKDPVTRMTKIEENPRGFSGLRGISKELKQKASNLLSDKKFKSDADLGAKDQAARDVTAYAKAKEETMAAGKNIFGEVDPDIVVNPSLRRQIINENSRWGALQDYYNRLEPRSAPSFGQEAFRGSMGARSVGMGVPGVNKAAVAAGGVSAIPGYLSRRHDIAQRLYNFSQNRPIPPSPPLIAPTLIEDILRRERENE